MCARKVEQRFETPFKRKYFRVVKKVTVIGFEYASAPSQKGMSSSARSRKLTSADIFFMLSLTDSANILLRLSGLREQLITK